MSRRLSSLKAVRRELSEVYQDARRGTVPVGDASRLAYMLAQLSGVIQAEIGEGRLAKLEQVADELERQN